ncbi:MAG: helix-turn-helix transcriptional regulator [Clostridiales bacterium]|nr:helix-turn-helix transcriptional regulator [Clostridiales bacterium]
MQVKQQQLMKAEIIAKFFSGFSNPVRYRVIEALCEKEMTVNELVSQLECSQSQISNHLNCLRWCGFVSNRQEGRHVYYQVTNHRIHEILILAKSVVSENSAQISSCTRM